MNPCALRLVVAFFFTLPLPASAQENTDDAGLEYSLEFDLLEDEMSADEVHSASKHRQSIFWSPSAITVFTRDDIRRSGANTLPDLLRRVPGFDVYEEKPSFPLIGARAGTDDSTNLVLVLIDGREALVELVGFPVWYMLPVDLDDIERVEVIRGPGSTLYGANAFAAVINITTVSEAPDSGADLFVQGGEVGGHRLFARSRASLDVGRGTLSFAASLGNEGRGSPSDPCNRISDVTLRMHAWVRYQDRAERDLSAHASAALGDGTMYMHTGDLQGRGMLTHDEMLQLKLPLGTTARLKAQVYHSRFRSDFHYRFRFTTRTPLQILWVANVPDFSVDTNTIDGQGQLDWDLTPDILLTSGVTLRFTHIRGTMIIPDTMTELRGGAFVHAEWEPWSLLQLNGGIRVDFNSQTTGAVSPRVVAVLRPFEGNAFRLGYALAFRKPSFIERQMHIKIVEYNPAMPEVVDQMATQFGNSSLTNEKVHSIEVGWRGYFLKDRIKASLDLFYNLYQDGIYFRTELPLRFGAPDLVNSILRFDNQADLVGAVGGEVELNTQPIDTLFLWTNLGLRKVTDLAKGQDLPAEPILRFNLGGGYNPEAGLFADTAVHYTSSHDTVLMDPENVIGVHQPVTLGQAWLLIARLGYRWELYEAGLWEAGLVARSPLGRPFREFGGVPIPFHLAAENRSDFGGEQIVRQISVYLRGGF